MELTIKKENEQNTEAENIKLSSATLRKRKKPSKDDEMKDIDRSVNLSLNPNAGKMIAVTGGIATGKTFVLSCFQKLGFEVFSADQAVHAMLKKEGKAFELVAEIFPNSSGLEGMDRKKMSEEILKDPSKLQRLEAILHPLVRSAQVDMMVTVKKNNQKSIVFEVPLLFENKREKYYDYIVLTATGIELQKERALARSNMTAAKFDLIIKKQLPVAEKIKKAHVVIKTNVGFEDTFNQVKEIVTTDVKRDNF